MKRLYIIVALLLALLVVLVGPALALQNSPGPDTSQGWPFGDGSQGSSVALLRDDVVITLGATALVPGSIVVTGLDILFGVDPFFTDSRTELTVMPTFAATQSLETGLVFDWWSATVDVNLSLAPWSLTSVGGWLELHPPQWVILTTPWISLEGDIGWGPQWVAAADWSHALAGSLDVLAIWGIPTLWGSSLDLSTESSLDATWTFPDGAFLTNWMVQLDARSILPLFEDSPVALRAGVRGQVLLLPIFGFGFDVRLELRANAFTAYGLIGGGDAGIRAEMGLEWSIGFSLFD
ncbi:hypothetical protein KAH43_00775 [Candidatus Bipolaricaulota bacterium]|nr:hypothetical protein [Candidatus Bipolaricaulota bacterium]